SYLFFQCLDKQSHQQRYFFGWTTPVFGAERKQGQILHTLPTALFHNAPDRLHTFGMTGGSGQIALGCPATIAVHNDGKVPGHSRTTRNIQCATDGWHALIVANNKMWRRE